MTSAELRKKLEEVQKARKKAEEREKAIKAKIKEAEIQEKQAKIEDLIKFIEKNIEDLSGDYITISATKELVLASEERNFYLCQNGGVLAIPDG